jgi:hypothetical protein
VLVEKASVRFFADGLQQLGNGRLDVADKSKINSGAAANVFRVLIDLDLLHPIAG